MNTADAPRETVIHQSANRPNLLLGGDRELVLVMVMIAGGLAFSLASWWGIGLAVALWIGSMAALQRMGKADPLLRLVYLRHSATARTTRPRVDSTVKPPKHPPTGGNAECR